MRWLALIVTGCTFSPVSMPTPPAGGSGDGSGSGENPMPPPPPPPARATFSLAGSGSAWQFEVDDGSGGKLLASADYADRVGAIGGVLWTFAHGADDSFYQVGSDNVVALVASNNHTMASSDPYASASDASTAIATTVSAIDAYLTHPRTGARFVVNADMRFEVHDAADAIVLRSESYSSTASAYNGAFAAQADGGDPASYAIGTDHSVSLVAPNGQVLATSIAYASDAAAQDAIDQLAALLPGLTVF
jgi:uncharacterized protein YegP (UPF0339 family)